MPLQVIEESHPLTELIEFRTGTVFEMMVSLQTILTRTHHISWAYEAETALGEEFLETARNFLAPYDNGFLFFELAIDYHDLDNVPGFFEYIRQMDAADFAWYVLGRLFTRQKIIASGATTAGLQAMVRGSQFEDHYCCQAPLEWADDFSNFKNELVGLWEWYWDSFFSDIVESLRQDWRTGINDKQNYLAREGGQGLLESMTHGKGLPDPLPPDQPYEEVVLIPVYFTPRNILFFYGYGNVTILFDCQQTESRRAEIEQAKNAALSTLRGLGDENRLKILRMITQKAGMMNGKSLAKYLELSPSAVSRHLSQLKEGNLITEESEDNRNIVYHLNRDTITNLPQAILDYLNS